MADLKQSRRKVSNSKRNEVSIMANRLVSSPEYKWIKAIAEDTAKGYRTVPGTTREENEGYLTHCIIVWAYNMMFKKIETFAKNTTIRSKETNADDGW